MEEINTTGSVTWSDEQILDLVRKLRNDLIKDFLDERNLIAFFAEQYNRKELNAARVELIKKELKGFLIEPVDKEHYKELIDQLRETGTASITGHHEELFHNDVTRVLKRFIY